MKTQKTDFKKRGAGDFKSRSPQPHSKEGSSHRFKQPKPEIQTTSLWDFPSQHYGDEDQGDGEYAGVTPSYVIWNLLQRYTKPKDIVLDPMCGSGTTLDVCKDLDRNGMGFDLTPSRPDVKKADARKLPVAAESVDFVFIDPPYSDHIKYSDDPNCIGQLNARDGLYYEAMQDTFASLYKTLKDGGYLALYVQDSFSKGKPFAPIGFELFLRLSSILDPVDIISVVRYNKKLKRNHWHTSAIEGNFFLRGFNYLFIFRKNKHRNDQFLKHAESSSLSQYFRMASLGHPDEVITPPKLMDIIKQEQVEMNQKLLSKEPKRAKVDMRKNKYGTDKNNVRKKPWKKNPS
jgi:adenine-specific DNA-methyltransferase